MPYYEYGTVSNEQDLVGALDTFLTGTVGTWEKIDTVTDTGTTKDLVFRSPGSGQHRYIYLRFRGNSDNVYIYGYSLWVDSGENYGELYNASYTRVYTGSSDINYWFFADIDYVWVIAQDTGSESYYSGYGGLIDTYYDAADDDLPLAVVGCSSASASLTGSSRIYMHSALVSGTNVLYYAADTHTGLLEHGDPSDRNSSVEANTPFILYTSAAGHKEVRGELKGAIYVSGASFNSAEWLTISGTDMMYFVKKYSESNCEAFGPTVSG